jgi:hypothetical protein
MSMERALYDESYRAEQDLSAKQFLAMELSAEGQVDTADAAADTVIGILQNKPKSGEAAEVRLIGISKAVTDGNAAAIGVGDFLGTNNAGKLVKKSTDKDWVIARALQASTADGTIISVLLTGGFHLAV